MVVWHHSRFKLITMRHYLFVLAVASIGVIHGEVAMAIEEPAFEKLEKFENIEIRQYRPFIVAETVADGDMSSASNDGFRRIADYIFGNNLAVRAPAGGASEKIAMTAPVSVEPAPSSEKIAMTAPVSVEPQANAGGGVMSSKRWRVQFSMPSSYTMATLPKPRNTAVTLREVPGKRFAVIVFSGFSGEEKSQQKTDELLAWLKANNQKPIGIPQLARYNPPWTLPFLRRNEILIEIAAS
jgi:hypothetical protein